MTDETSSEPHPAMKHAELAKLADRVLNRPKRRVIDTERFEIDGLFVKVTGTDYEVTPDWMSVAEAEPDFQITLARSEAGLEDSAAFQMPCVWRLRNALVVVDIIVELMCSASGYEERLASRRCRKLGARFIYPDR